MKNNIMVIGNKKEALKKEEVHKGEVNKEAELILEDASGGVLSVGSNTGQEIIQEPVYENDWGNDNTVLKNLDGKLLADRRLYARALYIQQIECDTTNDSLESEASLFRKRMKFMISDISLGGIGIVAEQNLTIGTILYFELSLDNIAYGIKCEVVYCFQNDDKYRAGLRIVERDRQFIRHLKILVARLSLQSKYGDKT